MQSELDKLVIDKVAKALNGPFYRVPEHSKFTLEELREVRWAQATPQMQVMLRQQARAAIQSIGEQQSVGWQPIESRGGRYEVSDTGMVRRADGLVLKQWKNDQGYLYVRLSRPRAIVRVHRVVAEAFIPNPEGKPFVNHINNDRADNRWENIAHADRQGRMQRDYWTGKRTPIAKLTDDQVRAIREAYSKGGVSWDALAKQYGIGKRTVGRIIKGETYADVR